MTTVDLVLRTAVSLELVVLATLLALLPRAGLAARLGALFCASVVAFVVTSAPIRLGGIVYPLTALCVAKSALFWLFAKALFRDGFRMRREHVVATLVLVALGLWHEFDFGRDVRAGLAGPFALLGSLAYEGLVLAFLLAAVHEAWRGLATDLVERRRRFRVGLVAGVAAYLAIVVTVQLSNLALGVHTAPPLVLANLGLMLAAGFAATLSLLQVRRGTWIDAAWGIDAEAAAGMAPVAEQALLVTLTRRMTGEALYRREGLTIGTLAHSLGTQEYLLRRVINGHLGYRNFNDFLHSYRIREACARLRSQAEARRPVLSIALDLGYNSIGPFNRAFKARMGMTPTEFRRDGALQPASASD
ncbi:MAG: helix-turn-helix transcriptional regulator [Betaproteobacteria bacterium]|nr:MAG: helix-turn-helix transcriptional regulator [Betaproteobacteria bacterium]